MKEKNLIIAIGLFILALGCGVLAYNIATDDISIGIFAGVFIGRAIYDLVGWKDNKNVRNSI